MRLHGLRFRTAAAAAVLIALAAGSRGDRAAAAPRAPHDLALVETKAVPTKQRLSTRRDNIVAVTSRHDGFAVTIANAGASVERGVRVTLRIAQQPAPVVGVRTVALISPRQRRTVVFRDLPVQLATRLRLEVRVERVQGETRLSNNNAAYSVVFSLG